MNTRTSKEKKHARKMKVIIKKLNVLFKIELTGEWFLKLATDNGTIEGTASSDVIKVKIFFESLTYYRNTLNQC